MDTTKQELLDQIYHLRDDLAQVRGDTIRVLNAEIRMLGDGLEAVESHFKLYPDSGTRHLHILVDHAERSRDSLVALLGKLTNYKFNGSHAHAEAYAEAGALEAKLRAEAKQMLDNWASAGVVLTGINVTTKVEAPELCGTVGCTYCDPANYDGWDDEDCSRQQVEADLKQCITAIRDRELTE